MAVWVGGGVFTLIGALCYAEMATAYPKSGGDYVFLTEAFGRKLGFLFAWSQFWIVRPGTLGITAFVYADYANQIFALPVGLQPVVVHAVLAIVVLTGVNLIGIRAGKTTQNVLTLVKFLGLLAIIGVGLSVPAATAAATSAKPPSLDLGFAMIFIFYAYSGWNEMAYVSAEVRDPRRNILRRAGAWLGCGDCCLHCGEPGIRPRAGARRFASKQGRSGRRAQHWHRHASRQDHQPLDLRHGARRHQWHGIHRRGSSTPWAPITVCFPGWADGTH